MSNVLTFDGLRRYDTRIKQYISKHSVGGTGGGKIVLGDLPERSVIQLNEGGKLVDFYVVKHNYEPDLNGLGRTLLTRVERFDQNLPWNEDGVNTLATSSLDKWLNEDYKSLLDPDVQTKMSETMIYYTPMGGDTTVSTLFRSIFLLSATEFGCQTSSDVHFNEEGSELGMSTILRTQTQLTRTPDLQNVVQIIMAVNNSAIGALRNTTTPYYFCPSFTLPDSYVVYGSDDSVSNSDGIPTIPITVAEYSALSEEEKNRDVIYQILDDDLGLNFPSSSGESTLDIYDDEERVVGIWYGKPLYKKTLHASVSGTPNERNAAKLLDAEGLSIVDVAGYADITFADGANARYYIPYTEYRSSSSVFSFSFEWYEDVLYLIYFTDLSEAYDCYATVRYTKDVDVPNAFVPSPTVGEPPRMIYSTEEQRIGTWLDGKPLYRRTYPIEFPSTVGMHRLIDVSGIGIDTLTDLRGVLNRKEMADQWPVNSINSGLSCWIGSTNMISLESSNTAVLGAKGYVVIEYTKTSDSEVTQNG